MIIGCGYDIKIKKKKKKRTWLILVTLPLNFELYIERWIEMDIEIDGKECQMEIERATLHRRCVVMKKS